MKDFTQLMNVLLLPEAEEISASVTDIWQMILRVDSRNIRQIRSDYVSKRLRQRLPKPMALTEISLHHRLF